MKKSSQGGKWRKLDNTGKIFPVIANENLSNVFRISMTLKEEIVPEVLQQALEEVLPFFPCFQVKLRRGFFWYYFEYNRRMPEIEKEVTYPCKYIDPHSNQLYLFRVSYYQCRINLEIFHALSDGLGAVSFLRELTCRYLQLRRDGDQAKPLSLEVSTETGAEDSYLKYYRKTRQQKYSEEQALQIQEQRLLLDEENVIHGYIKLAPLKKICKERGVSITKYLTACLIYSIYQEYAAGAPMKEPIGISLPVNLRAFFDSKTMANFFAVCCIKYLSQGEQAEFDEILDLVCQQMDENITKEKLEETISYNVSNEKKWYIRIVPLAVKWLVVNWIFWKKDKAHTITLSNLGPISVPEEFQEEVLQSHVMIGVSKRQPIKCAVCAYKDEVVVTFTSVFNSSRMQDRFFGYLKEQGIPVETESNGVIRQEDNRGSYPEISYNVDKWKKVTNVFYAVMLTLAACLGVINWLTYSGFLWSGIAIAGILYAVVSLRYSIMRNANLGARILIETIGAQALLIVIDHVLGYQGWSVDFAVPSTILFADLAIVFLILVNRLNWQSYFMYQLAVTVFSFIPILLWALGVLNRPVMAVITVIVSVMILTVTILLGDRSVKNELIRRFHF